MGQDMGQRFKEDLCVHTGLPSSLREDNWNLPPPHTHSVLSTAWGRVSKLEFPTQVANVGDAARIDGWITRVRQNNTTRQQDCGIQGRPQQGEGADGQVNEE